MQKLQTEQMGLILGAILVGVVIAALITMMHVSAATETQDHIVALVDSTAGHIISDKKSAQAIFIPASDVNGASNSDGHAFDLYYQDKNQNGYFFEYCYRSAANDCLAGQPMNTLVDYSYPSWRSLVRNGGNNAGVAIAQGPIDDLTTFAIKTYAGGAQISTLPEIASYASGHPISCSPQVYHWAYPGVTSSTCTVYRLTVGAGPEQVAANLVDSLIPFQQTIINGTKTPPPNTLTLSPASLSFRNPLDVAHSFTAAESNYGNRSTNPAQVYTLNPGDCGDNGSSGYPAGRNDATYTPGSPVTPTNNGSGQASVSVAPVKQLLNAGTATCGFNVVDNVGQTVAMNATIGQTFVPSAAGTTTNFTTVGMTVPISVQERNYDLPGSGGGFTAGILSGPCTAIGPAGQSMSTDGTYTETETWLLTFSGAGTCVVRFTDTYGQTAVASDTVNAPLTLEPGSIAMPVSGTALSYVDESALHTPAAIINQLLGGGIALASVGPCPVGAAVAYSDPNFSTPIAPGTTLGNELGIDPANGCMDGYGGVSAAGSVVVTRASEPGFNGGFNYTTPPAGSAGSCSGITQPDGWSSNGPTALLGLSGTAVGQCTFSVTGASGSSGTQSVNAKVTGGCVPGQVCGALGNNSDSDPGVPCVIRPGQPPHCVLPYFSEVENQYASFDGGFTWIGDGVYKCSGKISCTTSSWTGVTTPIPASSIRYNGSNSYDTRGGITSGPCTWTPTQPPGTLNGGSWPSIGC